VAIKQPLCPFGGLVVIRTNDWLEPDEMPVTSDSISPIFLHRFQFKGRRSPLRILATSGECNRSPPSQSMQRNLRPPVLTSTNRMGLWHFGQSGGGVFLGMALTLD
jgi:hypothetical protein